MFYAICDGVPGSSGPPFLFYKAETLGDLHSCPYINETSLIFDGNENVHRLNYLFTKDEIRGVCEPYNRFPSAENFWVIVHGKAKHWKPEEETQMNVVKGHTSTVGVVTEQPDVDPHTRITLELDEMEKAEPTVTKVATNNKDHEIVKLVDEPPIRKGTNRYRNMEVILASKTVGEAIWGYQGLSGQMTPFFKSISLQTLSVKTIGLLCGCARTGLSQTIINVVLK
jgi:hypothetical protein